MKQILNEAKAPEVFIPTKEPVLTESVPGRKVYIIEGIFGKVDTRNENNRKYPRTVWEKNLSESSAFKRRMKSRSVLGELEHPESGNTHLERVSHLILDAWVEELTEAKLKTMGLLEVVQPGIYVIGKYELLGTPKGQILKALHDAKVKVGVSSRGRGDVRSEGGVDVVCDDYELDTWDAVYLPSVTEAYPTPLQEAKLKEEKPKNLGSALPSATDASGATTDVTPTNTQPTDWKPEAEEIVRALETAVATAKDITELVEILPRGINLVDQLGSLSDEEAIRLKSQALTLIRVLTTKIVDLEAGKGKGAKKESRVVEGTLKDLATSVSGLRKKTGVATPMNKGQIEAELNKAGHVVDDAKIREFVNELKAQGIEADPTKYECITEATEEEMLTIQDGSIVSISAEKLVKACDSQASLKAYDKTVLEFLKKLEKQDVLVRVGSRGVKGVSVNLLEPGYAERDIFVEYKDVEKATTQLKENKEDEDMKVKEMLEQVVKENDELKAKIAEKSDKDSVPAVRYEAAKQLIRGLVERVKRAEKAAIHEGKRVKAAVKLIHKLVSEKKVETVEAPKVEEAKKDAPKVEAPKVEEAKKEEPKVAVSKTEPPKVVVEAKVEEAKKDEPKTETKITEDSDNLMKRLRKASLAKNAPIQESKKSEGSNLMSAVAAKLR